MSVRAWSFFPPSMRAQPSGQWRRRAVSYTHLDVYKRQVVSLASATGIVLLTVKKNALKETSDEEDVDESSDR